MFRKIFTYSSLLFVFFVSSTSFGNSLAAQMSLGLTITGYPDFHTDELQKLDGKTQRHLRLIRRLLGHTSVLQTKKGVENTRRDEPSFSGDLRDDEELSFLTNLNRKFGTSSIMLALAVAQYPDSDFSSVDLTALIEEVGSDERAAELMGLLSFFAFQTEAHYFAAKWRMAYGQIMMTRSSRDQENAIAWFQRAHDAVVLLEGNFGKTELLTGIKATINERLATLAVLSKGEEGKKAAYRWRLKQAGSLAKELEDHSVLGTRWRGFLVNVFFRIAADRDFKGPWEARKELLDEAFRRIAMLQDRELLDSWLPTLKRNIPKFESKAKNWPIIEELSPGTLSNTRTKFYYHTKKPIPNERYSRNKRRRRS